MDHHSGQDHLGQLMLPPRVWNPSYIWPADNDGLLHVVEGHDNPDVAEYRRHRQWLRAMGQATGPDASHVVSAMELDDFRLVEYDRFPTLKAYLGLSPIQEEFGDLIPNQLNVSGHASLEIPPLVHSDSDYSDDDSEALEKSPQTGNSPVDLVAAPEVGETPLDLIALGVKLRFDPVALADVDPPVILSPAVYVNPPNTPIAPVDVNSPVTPIVPVFVDPPNPPNTPIAPIDVNSPATPIVPVFVNPPNPPNTPITPLDVSDGDNTIALTIHGNVNTAIVGMAMVNTVVADTVIEVEFPSRSQKSKNIDGWLGDEQGSKGPVAIEQSSKGPVAAFRRSTIFLRGLGKKLLKQELAKLLAVAEVVKSKQIADGNDSPPPLPPKDRPVTPPKPNSVSPISLGPGEQALLYSRLEFMICETANAFLIQQYCDGRIDKHTINRVINGWVSKNLPQVSEFRFDQATQRDLINANRRTIEFTGSCSTNPVQLVANLRSWKFIIQDMNHRTFCLRDSAIRKQLYEIGQILDMLNAPITTLQAFDELRGGVLQYMISTPSSPTSSHSS